MLQFLAGLSFLPKLVLILSFFISLICLLVLKFQNKLIYIPSFGDMLIRSMYANPIGFRNPGDRMLSYKDVYIKSGKDSLHGWFIFKKHSENKSLNNSFVNEKGTVVFFHENAGNIGTRLAFFDVYMDAIDVNVLVIAYRGYSHSEGEPSEANLREDSLSIFNYVYEGQDLFDAEKAVFHGRSLGGAVLLYGATNSRHKERVKKVVIESTFTKMLDCVDVVFPRLRPIRFLTKYLLLNEWDNESAVQRLGENVTVLFIVGTKDELTPMRMVERLFELAKTEKKTILKIKDGEHNDTWRMDRSKYFSNVRALIEG